MCNIGMLDRILRLIVGTVLLSLVFFGPETPWGWAGIIFIATSIICQCPVYSVLGFSSVKK